MQQRTPLTIAIITVAMLLGAWLAHIISSTHNAPPTLQVGTIILPARPMPEFALQDAHGQPASQGTLNNHWSVLFFGYTTCPDVCPATLTQLAQVNKLLADLPANLRPQFIFISVDPKRDTPAQLAAYLHFFSPEFVGLTGTQENIDSFTTSLGVPVIVQPQAGGTYTIDHAATLFVIDPQAQLHAVFTPPYAAAKLANDLRQLVRQ